MRKFCKPGGIPSLARAVNHFISGDLCAKKAEDHMCKWKPEITQTSGKLAIYHVKDLLTDVRYSSASSLQSSTSKPDCEIIKKN